MEPMESVEMLPVFGVALMEELLPECTTTPDTALSVTRTNGAFGENE